MPFHSLADFPSDTMEVFPSQGTINSFPMYSGLLYSLGTQEGAGFSTHAETVADDAVMLTGISHAFPNQGAYEITRYYDNGAGSIAPSALGLKMLELEASPTTEIGMYVNAASTWLTQPVPPNFVYKPIEKGLYDFMEANNGWLRKITDNSIAQGSANWGLFDMRTPGLADFFGDIVNQYVEEYGIRLVFFDETHYTVEHLAKSVVSNILGVPLALTGVTSASSFSCSQLSAITNDFNGDAIEFTTGVLSGAAAKSIATYNQATGAMTFSPAWSQAPSVGDRFRFTSTLNIANKPTDAEYTAGMVAMLEAASGGEQDRNIWNGLLTRASAPAAFGGRMIQGAAASTAASVIALMDEVVANFPIGERICMLEQQNDTVPQRTYLAGLASLRDAQSGCGANNFTTVINMPYAAGVWGRPVEYVEGTSTTPVTTVVGNVETREFENAIVSVDKIAKTVTVVGQ